MNKKKTILAVIVLVLVVGGFFYFRSDNESGSYNSDDTNTSDVQSGEVEIKGIVACLPYRTVTAGAECVKAITGDDGKVYALDTSKVGGGELKASEGTKVTAVGTFQVANTSVDDSSVFRYDGVLVLRTLKTR